MSESKMKINEWGDKIWKDSKGKLHRTDGPAIEWSNGSKKWYINGKRHRLDGPAIEYADGSKEWWVDENRHRLDGPAVEYANGDKAWWVNGKFLGDNDSGFCALWERLSDEDRANPTLLSYLPGGFNV
jgi:hypothetical protein